MDEKYVHRVGFLCVHIIKKKEGKKIEVENM